MKFCQWMQFVTAVNLSKYFGTKRWNVCDSFLALSEIMKILELDEGGKYREGH